MRVVFSSISLNREEPGDMSPRPRQTSDEAILMATMRVMQRRSPVDLTLADVGKEAGVVPATLIQRFGTKRSLLLAAWLRRSIKGLLAPYRLGVEADLPKARTGRMQNNRR